MRTTGDGGRAVCVTCELGAEGIVFVGRGTSRGSVRVRSCSGSLLRTMLLVLLLSMASAHVQCGGSSSGLSGGGATIGGTWVRTSRGGVRAMRVHLCSGSLLCMMLLALLLSAVSARVQCGGGSSGLSGRRGTTGWTCVLTSRGGHAGALVLVLRFGLVVSCGGADESVDGWGDVGTAVVVEGISIGVAGVVVTAGGGGVPGDAGTVEVAAVSDIGTTDVEGAGGGDDAGGVVDSAASPVIIVVILETRGRQGVSDVRGAGSSMVEVEGMRYMLKGRE